jgi:Fe-S oxidoreductase
VQTHDPKYTSILKLELLRRFYRRELSPQRWLYRLLSRDITAQELAEWEALVFDSCTECGRCALICPMGINIPKMVHVNRGALAEAGVVPKELRLIVEEQGDNNTIFGAGATQLREAVEQLRAQGIEVPLDKEKADVLVLTTVVDILLFADSLAAITKIMNYLGLDWTLASNGFEAANFGLLSGYDDLQRTASQRIIDAATQRNV